MKITLTILLITISTSIFSQSLENFEQVDKFKINDLKVSVYFKDPLKEIIKLYPDFDNKENKEKHDILSGYLHNNTLYIFQTFRKKELIKSYRLTGNPQKVKSRNYFNLDIYNNQDKLEKSIDKINVGGSFFEHMFFFQTTEGKKVIGKGIQMWGFFVMIQPYSPIKEKIAELIKMDISNSIPEDLIAKEQIFIEPLFDYQKCGLEKIKARTKTITVYQYDSIGNIKNKYPRVEKDTSLYLSSTSKDLGSVTSFPYFSKTDTIKREGKYIYVKSGLENINHYLKDVRLTEDSLTGQVMKVEGKLIIHGYNKDGHYTYDEQYVADFEKVGDCYFPRTIKYYPIEDEDLLRPRIITEIEYELK
jgi:hypothetical protein